jgi:DNA-binding response OmpR family regulator
MPSTDAPGHRPSHRTIRFVIVEPHDDSRGLYEEYFDWARVGLTTVPTAADALRTIRRETPEAVVTCLRLPDMDGFALCDALRAMPRANRIPVIALSTCRPDYERAVRDTRFAMVLMKPCSLEILLGSLRGALAAGNVRREFVTLPSGLERTAQSRQ